MKHTIRLNERELHNLISESVNRILNEVDDNNSWDEEKYYQQEDNNIIDGWENVYRTPNGKLIQRKGGKNGKFRINDMPKHNPKLYEPYK